MDCPECGTEMVAFAAPAVARGAAPGDVAAICPKCLELVQTETADPDPDFSRIVESFPEGETGATMAIAVGLLVESLALNRTVVVELFESIQDENVDPWLVIERLAASPTIQSGVDLGRARDQLEQLMDG